MAVETYKETVYRYRIYRHDDLPEGHKEEYRKKGINPDEIWNLIWSFQDEPSAKMMLKELETDPDRPSYYTYKLVDGGETAVIDRPIW